MPTPDEPRSDNPPTVTLSVDRLVEIQNFSGDTLCVSPIGKQGWHAQVVRGGQRHRRGSMQVLNLNLQGAASLKTAVDAFLAGNYRDFQESKTKGRGTKPAILDIVLTLVLAVAALSFVAFLISVFLRIL